MPSVLRAASSACCRAWTGDKPSLIQQIGLSSASPELGPIFEGISKARREKLAR